MADPITMAAVGAVAGAAVNRDDPMRGALMGAALGGGAGGLLGGAASGLGAAEGAVGASELGALARPDVAPVLSDYITQAQAAGQVPITPALMPEFYPVSASTPADLSWMDKINASQQAAIETGRLPGAFQIPFMGGAMSALQQAQPRAQMQAPGVKRGDPRSVNYGGFASLLEPKLVERRRVSLI